MPEPHDPVGHNRPVFRSAEGVSGKAGRVRGLRTIREWAPSLQKKIGVVLVVPRTFIRSERPMRNRQIILNSIIVAILALIIGLQPGDRHDVSDGPAATGETPGAQPERDVSEVERATILSLVRAHRRTAAEDWRQSLADTVYRESVAAGIDPLMVAAIVARESSFSTRAISRVGAVGLMQVRPFVGREVAERTNLEWRGTETLYDPELNVRLGILYYQEMLERFEGDPEIALAAYNRGPWRVSRELRQGKLDDTRYAERVLGLYRALDAQRDSQSATSG